MVLPGCVWCLLLRLKLFGFIVFDFFNFPQQSITLNSRIFFENEPKIIENGGFCARKMHIREIPRP